MSRVLVTGCLGFVGRALVERLVTDSHDVWGVDRSEATSFAGAEFRRVDMMDRAAVCAVVADANPDAIIHLAAQASVRHSFDDPHGTIVNNTIPALHLLTCLRDSGSHARLVAIGSADEYGTVAPERLPLTEATPVNPESPYALGKSIQNQCCRAFAVLYKVNVVMTRSFNHTGPGQREVFVMPSFARQVIEIKLGRREPVINVGNIRVRRDFLDIRDVCRAYAALMRDGHAAETYNVCSGRSYGIGDLLDEMCGIAGVDVEVRVDPDRLRPVDMPELRGDATKIKQDTGWEPEIPIAETLRSLLDYWEQTLSQTAAGGGSE